MNLGCLSRSVIVFLVVLVCATSIVAAVDDVTGTWKMTANTQFQFDFGLTQTSNTISGHMTRTNGQEPVDTISGWVFDNGNIQFIRDRPGSFTQIYTGQITGTGDNRQMSGTFTHNGDGAYPWSATIAVKAKTILRPLPLLILPKPSVTDNAQPIANVVMVWEFSEKCCPDDNMCQNENWAGSLPTVMAFMDDGTWGKIPYGNYQEKPSKKAGNWKRDGNQLWWHDDRTGKDHHLNWAEDKMEGQDDGCYDMTRVS